MIEKMGKGISELSKNGTGTGENILPTNSQGAATC